MTENIRSLDDETFPNSLWQSVGSNDSGLLENVSLHSNLGLPIAASTVARTNSSPINRIPDAQESYLEEGRLSTGQILPPNVLNSETCKKFALSFKDELVGDDFGAHCVSDMILKMNIEESGSPLLEERAQHESSRQNKENGSLGLSENQNDFSSGMNTSDSIGKQKNKIGFTKKPAICPAETVTNKNLSAKQQNENLTSLLEDEKLVSLASLEDSSDDDLDPEELYDDRLESYFKQLIPPGMQRGYIEGEELPEGNTALQDHANFQMPPVRLAATGMDSAPTSGENTEDELEAVQKQGASRAQFLSSATRQLLGESSSFRPWLEGGSSDESTEAEDENNRLEFRRSAEGQVISSPVVGDGGGAGDGSSGSEDDGNGGGVAIIPSSSTTSDDLWGLGIAGRNIAGEEDDNNMSSTLSIVHDDFRNPAIRGRNVAGEDQGPNLLPLKGSKELLHGQNETGSRLGPVGNGEVSEFIPGTVELISTTHRQEVLDAMDSRGHEEIKLDSLYFGPASGNITTDQFVSGQDSPFQFSQLACSPSNGNDLGLRDGPCGNATVGQTSTKKTGDDADPTPNSTLDAPLSAAYLSPVYPEESATDVWQFEQNTDCNSGCFHQENEEKEESPPDVVYQNEEGSWVTDLAYYYSLDKEQEQFNLPSHVAQQIPEEEFITGHQAVALIEQDQAIFEQEHKFIQEDKMNVDADFHGDDSWWLPSNRCSKLRALRAASDCMQGNESYLRLSLGEFFGQRSEALGCLGEDCSGIKRPSFGYDITSPEKRSPVALITPGSMSRTLTEQEEMDLLCGNESLCPDDLECTYQETPTEASATFTIDEEIESGKLGTSMDESSNVQVHDFDDRKNLELQSSITLADSVASTKENSLPDASDSVLSISTIASAIADASVSADPAQLAAMILALSHKNRKKYGAIPVSRKPNLQPKDQQNNINSESTAVSDKNLQKSRDTSLDNRTLKSDITLGKWVPACNLELGDNSASKNQHCRYNSVSGKLVLSNNLRPETRQNIPMLALNADLRQSASGEIRGVAQSIETGQRAQLAKDKMGSHNQNSCASEIFMGVTSKFHPCPESAVSKVSNARSAVDGQSPDKTHKNANSYGVTSKLEKEEKSILTPPAAGTTHLLEHEAPSDKAEPNMQTEHRKMRNSSEGKSWSPPQTSHVFTSLDKRKSRDERKSTRGIAVLSGPFKAACRTSDFKTPNIHNVPTAQRTISSTNQSACKNSKEMCLTSESSCLQLHSQDGVSFEKADSDVVSSPTRDETSIINSKLLHLEDNQTEYEQLNFRPSTSPLTHSSPSQGKTRKTLSSVDSPNANSTHLQTVSKSSLNGSPNLSRLSYISAVGGTLQNNTSVGSLKNDKTIELSTTIVQSSPTPTPDETMVDPNASELVPGSLEECKEDACVQNVQSACVGGIELQSHECQSLEDKGEDGSQNSNQAFSSLSDKAKTTPYKVGQQDFVTTSIPTAFQESAEPKVHPISAPSVDYMNRMHNVNSLNVVSVASHGLSGFPLSNSDGKYLPISCFKSHTAGLDTPPVPTLLTGQSLLTTPLAQQYLGTLTSATNCLNIPLTSCYNSGNSLPSNVYSLAAGLPGPNVLMSNFQGFGSRVDPILGAGVIDPAQLYSAQSASLDQNFKASSFTCQIPRMGVCDQWSDGFQLGGIGHVVVPEELRFPNSCCVGIATQTSLSIFNPTDRWMQISIRITSVALNGTKVDTFAHQCWIFKNKTIIGPHATEDLKLLFLPRQSGIFQCVLCVSSWPVSADASTIARAEALSHRVIVTAVAEDPSIEVESGKGCLDFGDVILGGAKALPLQLTNRTHATVPIRLNINASAAVWQRFTFSKSDVLTENALLSGRIVPSASPSFMNHVMHASYDGEDPETFIVWIHFHAPQKPITGTDPLGPADVYLARIDVEVDSPGPTSVINSIALYARVGIVRIHAPKDLQTLPMLAKLGTSAKQILPLKNAGNILAELTIQAEESSCFAVKPNRVSIPPGKDCKVTILFTPKDTKSEIQSLLTILVQPSGPQYEMVLKGILGRTQSNSNTSSDPSVNIPPILSNKQFISWGGVCLGRAVQQKFTLRNNSASVTHQLRLLIRGQDQDCFQLQSTFGPEERLSSNRELTIRPKEDVCVRVLFAPTRVACMVAKLEIKQSGLRSMHPGVKFTIPLSGYGGTSNIILEDTNKLSDSYVITLNDIAPNKISTIAFSMRNTGSRAAFVKAVCFTDLQTKTLMDPKVIKIAPDQFILKERTRETVTVIYHPIKCVAGSSLLCVVCFFNGDEMSRQLLRRTLHPNPYGMQQILSDNHVLQNLNFNESFMGEELVSEVYDLPQRPNDIRIFNDNLSKVTLSIIGNAEFNYIDDGETLESSSSNEMVESLIGANISGGLERKMSNISLDVLPVRGPQGCPLSASASDRVQNLPSNSESHSWTIQPEHLILTVPSSDGLAQTGRVQIKNHSTRSLSFELSWPAHSLTVTPQQGVIDPQSHLMILVSPNPSLAAKRSAVPWSGQIYVHCDNMQQLIKVQIREDIMMDTSPVQSSPNAALDVEPVTPPNYHVGQPLSKPSPTKVQVKSKTVRFPSTSVGLNSESFLEISNAGEGAVKWFLSSFAPPYVKWVDDTGDVYRATYTAFRCTRVSGMLQAHCTDKVPVVFMPRDKGEYAQFWDLECRVAAEPHRKHKIQFQLRGEGKRTQRSSQDVDLISNLVKTELKVKNRKPGSERYSNVGPDRSAREAITAPQNVYVFPETRVGESSALKVHLRNFSSTAHMLKFINPREPFYIKHSKYILRAQHFINLPVQFKPVAEGRNEAILIIKTDSCGSVPIRLIGAAVGSAQH